MALSKVAKLKDKASVEELNAPIEELDMDIDVNAKEHILERLTEMYPYAIEATVRELISNALDASIAENVSTPIEVEFNTMEGNFIVQDHGTGMTYDEACKYYRLYGASSKADDMRQIGAFGLGAKAPLAYTPEFSVRTVKNGLALSFTMSNSVAGHKMKIFYKDRPVQEPNGTKVTVPVNNEDQGQFLEVVRKYQLYSLDLEILVNGESKDTNAQWVPISEIVLDHDEVTDEEVTGRVFVNTNAVFDPTSMVYWLGGWPYAAPNSYNRNNVPSVLVELKPGVVNFVSSRDAIIYDADSRKVHDSANEYLSSDDLSHQILKAIDSLDLTDEEKITKLLSVVGSNRYTALSQFVHGAAVKNDERVTFTDEVMKLSLGVYLNNLANDDSVVESIMAQMNRSGSNYSYTHICSSRRSTREANAGDLVKNFDTQTRFTMLEVLTILNNSRSNSYGRPVSRDFAFITDVNADNIRGVLSSRRAALGASDEPRQKYFILVSGTNPIPTIFETLVDEDDELEVHTADDFISAAKEWRKANKKTTATVSVEFSLVGSYSEKGTRTFEGVSTAKVDDFTDVDLVVALDSNRSRSPQTYIHGLENAGYDVEGHNVLFIDSDNMNTTTLKRLQKENVEVKFNYLPNRGEYIIDYAAKNRVESSNYSTSQIVKMLKNDFGRTLSHIAQNSVPRYYGLEGVNTFLNIDEFAEVTAYRSNHENRSEIYRTQGNYTFSHTEFENFVATNGDDFSKEQVSALNRVAFLIANQSLILGLLDDRVDNELRDQLLETVKNYVK